MLTRTPRGEPSSSADRGSRYPQTSHEAEPTGRALQAPCPEHAITQRGRSRLGVAKGARPAARKSLWPFHSRLAQRLTIRLHQPANRLSGDGARPHTSARWSQPPSARLGQRPSWRRQIARPWREPEQGDIEQTGPRSARRSLPAPSHSCEAPGGLLRYARDKNLPNLAASGRQPPIVETRTPRPIRPFVARPERPHLRLRTTRALPRETPAHYKCCEGVEAVRRSPRHPGQPSARERRLRGEYMQVPDRFAQKAVRAIGPEPRRTISASCSGGHEQGPILQSGTAPDRARDDPSAWPSDRPADGLMSTNPPPARGIARSHLA